MTDKSKNKTKARVAHDNLDESQRTLLTRFFESGKLLPLLKGIGLFLKDYESGACISNTLWKDFGYTEDDMRQQNWKDFVHPEDRLTVEEFDGLLQRGETDTWTADVRIRDRSGKYHHVQHKALVLARNEKRVPTLYAGWDFDVTAYNERIESAQSTCARQERRLMRSETIRSVLSVLSAELDPEQAAERILSQAELVLPFDASLAWLHEDGQLVRICSRGPLDGLPLERNLPALAEADRGLTPVIYREHSLYTERLEIPLIFRGGLIGYLDLYSRQAATYTSEDTAVALILGEQAAMTFANAMKYRQSEKEAAQDWLTGLPTRRAFMARTHRLQEQLPPSTAFAVFMIDIDHFKLVNDRFGHATGDTVLVAVANACRSALRSEDILCRYGGEEIVSLIPSANEAIALTAAERIRSLVSRLVFPEYPGLSVAVSIGIHLGLAEDSIEQLIAAADRALYMAKEGGRNRSVLN